MEAHEYFRIHLNELLDSRGMNYTELARLCEVSSFSISRYANGKRRPNFEILVALAKALNVSTDWLVGLTGEADQNRSEISYLYNLATDEDRKLVDMILSKYKEV